MAISPTTASSASISENGPSSSQSRSPAPIARISASRTRSKRVARLTWAMRVGGVGRAVRRAEIMWALTAVRFAAVMTVVEIVWAMGDHRQHVAAYLQPGHHGRDVNLGAVLQVGAEPLARQVAPAPGL